MASKPPNSNALQTGSKRQISMSLPRDRMKKSIYTESFPSRHEEVESTTTASLRRVSIEGCMNCRVLVDGRQPLSVITNSKACSSFLEERTVLQDTSPVSSEDSSDSLSDGLTGSKISDDAPTGGEIEIETLRSGSGSRTSGTKCLPKMECLFETESSSMECPYEAEALLSVGAESKSVSDSETSSESESLSSLSRSLTISSNSDRTEEATSPEVVDLTGDDAGEVVTISSSECSLHSPKSSASAETTLSEKKRRKIRKRGDIFQDTQCVKDMTELQLRRWLYIKKPLMIQLFKGEEHSWRHDNFAAGCKKRSTLIHQMDTHHFHKDHVDIITDTLMHIFCGKDMKYYGYVMSVLLPECLVRIIADIHKVSFKEADAMMMDYSGRIV